MEILSENHIFPKNPRKNTLKNSDIIEIYRYTYQNSMFIGVYLLKRGLFKIHECYATAPTFSILNLSDNHSIYNHSSVVVAYIRPIYLIVILFVILR